MAERGVVVGALRAHGARSALVGSVERSYAELADAVEALASQLPAAGLAVAFGRWDEPTVVGYLAARAAGLAVAVLPAALGPGRRRALLDALRPEVVLDGGAVEPGPPGAGPVADDLALLLSTSGSLGSPRMVRLSDGAVAANTAAVVAALDVRPVDVALAGIELASSYGLSVLHSHLSVGAAIALTEHRPTTLAFWRDAALVQASTCALAPHTLSMLAGRPTWLGSGVRTITSAGGPARVPAVRALVDRLGPGRRLFVMYGQTEATARLSVLDAVARPDKIGSVGRPIEGVEIHVEPFEGDTGVGELVCDTPGRMLGYASRRDQLDAAPERGPLRTGDLGWIDDDGFVHVVGRASRVVKVLGNRISLDELEGLLGGPGEVAVIAPDGEHLAVTCAPSAAAEVNRSLDRLAGETDLPRSRFRLRTLAGLPRTATGKVDYGVLAEVWSCAGGAEVAAATSGGASTAEAEGGSVMGS